MLNIAGKRCYIGPSARGKIYEALKYGATLKELDQFCRSFGRSWKSFCIGLENIVSEKKEKGNTGSEK
tara:strand:+ start:182 stop:385 length:204 start_codon:yes stop_codon:yes gene_type:complete